MSSYRIEKLTEDNYYTWKRYIEGAMLRDDCYNAVVNLDLYPEDDRPKKDAQARGLIITTVSHGQLHLLDGQDTAAEMWAAIRAAHSGLSHARLLDLKVELATFAMKGRESVSQYFGRLYRLRDALQSAGHVMSAADQKEAIVMGLSSAYRGIYNLLVDFWLTDEGRTMAELQARLQQEERYIGKPTSSSASEKRGPTPGASALKATATPSHNRHSKTKCQLCGKPGHSAPACHRLSNPGGGKPTKCGYCGGTSHSTEQCYQKRIANAKSGANIALGKALVATPTISADRSRYKYTAGGYDPADFMLNRIDFLDLDDEFGPFDIDAFAASDGSNAQLEDYGCAKDHEFTSTNPEGYCLYINPPFKKMAEVLMHYKAVKARSPTTTSAVIIAPYAPKSRWWHLTKKMKVVRHWRAGQPDLFTSPGPAPYSRRCLGPCPFEVVALYDPPSAAAYLANPNTEFIIDSGASHHMVNDPTLIHDMRDPIPSDDEPLAVSFGDGESLPVKGVGHVWLRSPKVKGLGIRLTSVLFVPGLTHNLVSVQQMTHHGASVLALSDVCLVITDEQVVLKGNKRGPLYVLNPCWPVPNTVELQRIEASMLAGLALKASGTAGACARAAPACTLEAEPHAHSSAAARRVRPYVAVRLSAGSDAPPATPAASATPSTSCGQPAPYKPDSGVNKDSPKLEGTPALHQEATDINHEDSESTPTEGGMAAACLGARATTMRAAPSERGAGSVPSAVTEAQRWHMRLGHLGYRNLSKLTKIVTGIKVPAHQIDSEAFRLGLCTQCVTSRSTRDPRVASTEPKEKVPLARLHMDLCGPMPVESFSGNRYYLAIIDEATRFSVLRVLPTKSAAADAIKSILSQLETATGYKTKAIRCDQGREFLNRELQQWADDRGIAFEATSHYSPESNGIAERFNRTIMERVRAMLKGANLPDEFWAEAATYANLLRNYSPASSLNVTPFEAFTGRRPDLTRLRTFGSLAFVHVPAEVRRTNPRRNKLDDRAVPGVLLSCNPPARTYRVWCDGVVHESRDVIIDESRLAWTYLNETEVQPTPSDDGPRDAPPIGARESSPSDDHGDSPAQEADVDNHLDRFSSDSESTPEAPTSSTTDSDAPRYPQRERRAPERLGVGYGLAAVPTEAAAPKPKEPATIREAKASPEADQWLHAAQEELDALAANGTWELVQAPAGEKILPCKWVFKLKTTGDGSIERFKARLVCGGHRQADGIDYADVFAPVSRYPSLRALLAKAAVEDLELGSVDISNAFLNGVLTLPVYMRQPEGFEQGGPNTVCKLKKTLYGLKQAPKEWFEVLKAGLNAIGFQQSTTDQALWVRGGKHPVYLLHWVDDLLIATASAAELAATKAAILSKFKGRDLGNADYYLSIAITRDRERRTINLAQPKHAEELLERFKLLQCNPKTVPISTGADLSKAGAADAAMENPKEYAQCVGALMYLATTTRPDLCFAASALARHMANPCQRHWVLLKGVLRYLARTRTQGITYGTCTTPLVGYTDADYAGCKDTRRSRTGFVFMLYGGAISWSSKLQSVVATSTAESEYIAAASAARECIWLRRMMSELSLVAEGPVVLNADNKAAIAMAGNNSDSTKTKHIDIACHFLRQAVARKVLHMYYVNTDKNTADIFTKALGEAKFIPFAKALGLNV